MLWFRRNLFWAVFGLAGFLLLACGGWYLWSGISENTTVDTEIEAAKSTLNLLVEAKPSLSDTNIEVARASKRQLEQITSKTQRYFGEIPHERCQGVEFLTVLNSNLASLRLMASNHNVYLPSEFFAFSFEEQINKAKFADRSFPVLAEQLAEVRLIVTPLLEANINRLTSVKRSKTPDDVDSSPYCHRLPRIPDLDLHLVVCPYEVTFYAFSAEIGQVLENLCKAEKFIAVKSVVLNHEVDPKGPSNIPGVQPPTRSGPRPGGAAPNPPRSPRGPRPPAKAGQFAPPPPLPKGVMGVPGDSTEPYKELSEQRCRVTLLLQVVKSVPPAPSK